MDVRKTNQTKNFIQQVDTKTNDFLSILKDNNIIKKLSFDDCNIEDTFEFFESMSKCQSILEIKFQSNFYLI